jgi:dihydrodipicolinate synthase/N-acetylneuraminate lyase
MLDHNAYGGILAMMPAFSTDDAGSYAATDTVAVDELQRAVSAAIDDGIGVVATTGSFGEFHTLLPNEWRTLVEATVGAAGGRVPVVIGTTDVNARVAIARAREAASLGADAVLVGVPFYFPSTVSNAMRFYRELSAAIPSTGVMIYHNPELHRIELPVEALGALVAETPNIVAMKDGNRDPRSFAELVALTKGRVSVFSTAWQYHSYAPLGAAGFWSYDLWMGPDPHIALLRAVEAGDMARAAELVVELYPSSTRPASLSWRETLAKLAIAEAGYCQPGPLRPPFCEVPDDVRARAGSKARAWLAAAERVRQHTAS